MEKYNKGEFKGGSFRLPVADRTVTTEINQDFTLPDYQPEIKRLLRVDITLPPQSHYISPGGAEFSGPVHFDLLYAGADNQLYSARLSTEYDFEVPFEDVPGANLTEGVIALAETVPESVSGRVLAPRRVGMRARLRSKVRADAQVEQQIKITGLDDPSTLRYLTDSGSYAVILGGSEDEVPLSDEIIVGQGEGEIRVISADGDVFVREATSVADGVACRGDLILKMIVCRDGEDCEPMVITRKLPFSQTVVIEGVEPGWESRAWGVCNDVKITVGEGRIIAEAIMSLIAEAQRAEEFEYIKDVYSTAQEVMIDGITRRLTVPVRNMNGNFTQSGVFDAKENNIPSGAEILDVEGSATAGSLTQERGRGVITGDVRYNVVFRDGDEWGSRELTQPFRYEFDLAAAPSDGSAIMTVTGSRARMDGERISIDSEVAAALRLLSMQDYNMVDEADFSGSIAAERGAWTVFYPDNSDTLWGVAKKFHTDADRLAASNSLKVSASPNSHESLAGAKFIII